MGADTWMVSPAVSEDGADGGGDNPESGEKQDNEQCHDVCASSGCVCGWGDFSVRGRRVSNRVNAR